LLLFTRGQQESSSKTEDWTALLCLARAVERALDDLKVHFLDNPVKQKEKKNTFNFKEKGFYNQVTL